MVYLAQIQDNSHVLELWFWKWNITKEIIGSHAKNIHISALEIDKNAYESVSHITQSHNNISLYHSGAENIVSLLGKESVDVIISSLPLGSLSQDQNDTILDAMHQVLKSGGKYIQYQYWPKNKDDVEKRFAFDHIYYDVRNVPPVFIYVTHK